MLEICAHYDPPPIPDRRYDWTAVRGDFDLGCLVGYGRTEEAAIADLLDREEECGGGPSGPYDPELDGPSRYRPTGGTT